MTRTLAQPRTSTGAAPTKPRGPSLPTGKPRSAGQKLIQRQRALLFQSLQAPRLSLVPAHPRLFHPLRCQGENPRDSAHSSPKSLHSPEVPVLGGPGPARPPNRPCSQGEKLRPCQITRPAAELKAPRGRVLSSNEASCQGDPRSEASGEGVKASQSTTSPEASASRATWLKCGPLLGQPPPPHPQPSALGSRAWGQGTPDTVQTRAKQSHSTHLGRERGTQGERYLLGGEQGPGED